MPSSEPTAGPGTGRLSLGDVTIFTCLVGGVAAISTAGIAFPIESVGFSEGWLASGPFSKSAKAPQQAPGVALAAASAPRPRGQTTGQTLAAGVLAAPLKEMAITGPVLAAPLRIVQARPTALSLVTDMQLGIRDQFGLRLPPASDATTNSEDAPGRAELAQSSSIEFAPGSVTPPQSLGTAGLAASASTAETVPASNPGIAGLGIIEASEVSNFDLGKVRGSAGGLTSSLAKVPSVPNGNAAPTTGLQRDTVVGDALFHQVGLTVAGSSAQSVAVRIGDDMKPSIKVADLLGLVAAQLDPDSAARFTAAASAQDYVSLATLRDAGFTVTYNAAADSISIGAGN